MIYTHRLPLMGLLLAAFAIQPAALRAELSAEVDLAQTRTLDLHHRYRLQELTVIVNKLIVDKEFKVPNEQKRSIKALMQRVHTRLVETAANPINNYELAQLLSNIISLEPTIDSFDPERLHNRSVDEATEVLITSLEERLATRGIGPIQRCTRPLFALCENYPVIATVVGVLGLSAVAQYLYKNYYLTSPVAEKITTEQKILTRPAHTLPNDRTPEAPSVSKDHKAKVDGSSSPSLSLSAPWGDQISGYFFDKGARKAFIGGLAGSATWKAVTEKTFSHKAAKVWDKILGSLAKIRGVPFRDSNPALASKLTLTDMPAPAHLKEHLALYAAAIAEYEPTMKMRGVLSRTFLFAGDPTLTVDLARAFAHEISEQLTAGGYNFDCKVVRMHISKLLQKKFKDELEEIKTYNESAVIVIEDLDWIADEDRTKLVAELLTGISGTGLQHERYVLVGTTRHLQNVDPVLRHGTAFGQPNTIILEPSQDPELTEACLARIEQLYSIPITDPELRAQMIDYLHTYSFGELAAIVATAYTKSLPHLTYHPFNEAAIKEELATHIGEAVRA